MRRRSPPNRYQRPLWPPRYNRQQWWEDRADATAVASQTATARLNLIDLMLSPPTFLIVPRLNANPSPGIFESLFPFRLEFARRVSEIRERDNPRPSPATVSTPTITDIVN